MRTSRLFC